MTADKVERRLLLPLDRREPAGALSEVTREARARLRALRRAQAAEAVPADSAPR